MGRGYRVAPKTCQSSAKIASFGVQSYLNVGPFLGVGASVDGHGCLIASRMKWSSERRGKIVCVCSPEGSSKLIAVNFETNLTFGRGEKRWHGNSAAASKVKANACRTPSTST